MANFMTPWETKRGGINERGRPKKEEKEESTLGQNQVVLRHRIIHFSTSSGVSECASGVSKRGNVLPSGLVRTSLLFAILNHCASGRWSCKENVYSRGLLKEVGGGWVRFLT